MSEHKFEAFDRVLVRDSMEDRWAASFYSHPYDSAARPHKAINDTSWVMCIPYTPETAHLLGTSNPYEPPKPPHEYKWGDRVEACIEGEWKAALHLAYDEDEDIHEVHSAKDGIYWISSQNLRPLEPSHD